MLSLTIYPQITFPFELCGHPFHTAETMLPSLARLAKRPITAAEQTGDTAGRVPGWVVHKSATYKFRIKLMM